MAANSKNTFNVNASAGQMSKLLTDRPFCSALNLELKSENPAATGTWYRFHHGVTMTSWGEKITITVTPTGNNSINLEIYSECALPTQIFDWGKNKKNIETIFDYINKNLNRYSADEVNARVETLDKKFCTTCGNRLDLDANFCTKCGAKQPE